MKQKLFIIFIFFTGILNAQVVCNYSEEVNKSLVITEARMANPNDAYIEITNMGSAPIQLSDFKYGQLTAASNTRAVIDSILR